MSTADSYARRLGKLAVEVGANVAAGQDLVVLAMDVQQAPVARAVADAAYEAGARYVSVVYWEAHAKRARLMHAPEDSLSFVPDWYERLIADAVESRGALIVILGAIAIAGCATAATNIFLAGDWTRSGWPATMEGAVRSGYIAAEAVTGRKFLLPDAG